jgi:hypothetical protein
MTLIVILVPQALFVQAVQPFLWDALLVKDLILPQLHVLFKLHAILAIIYQTDDAHCAFQDIHALVEQLLLLYVLHALFLSMPMANQLL